jgi:myo-inositol-1(or 4)-monophosphatase
VAVLAVLRDAFPQDAFIAEESSVLDPAMTAAVALPARRTWIVDPLDGTVNFAHGIPIFSVSVGLVVAGEPTVGVVIAPAIGETFEGERGGGARLNGEPIRVSGTADLADAILATGFAYDIENLADQNFDNLRSVATAARGVRRLGSAAIDLAWVAAGRFDGFWELHLSPWDVAGAVALIREAGGLVTDLTGGADWLFGRHLAASNGALHTRLLAKLARPSFARKGETP